jgi:surfeit locus 1 family protein
MIAGNGRFRPRLVPTLFTLAAFAVCAGLGAWQVERLQWKRGLIAQREAALAAAPVAGKGSLAEGRGV